MAVTYSALVSQNGALLNFWLKVFVQNSKLHGVIVYTKSVKESAGISCISLQSSKRSFRKIQIFKFAYSALLPQKSLLHRVVYTWKPLKNRKRLVASRYSLRGARFAKYRILNLHILHFRCFCSLVRLSNRGIGLLWHWICSFQYMIIHFVSFRFVSQNTVRRTEWNMSLLFRLLVYGIIF